MGKVLRIKSCAKGGEYNGLGAVTPSGYNYIGVDSPTTIATHINNEYASDPNLSGKIEGIGYGWQKFVIPTSGKIKFTVRGSAGGVSGVAGYTINATTGAVTGSGNRPRTWSEISGYM